MIHRVIFEHYFLLDGTRVEPDNAEIIYQSGGMFTVYGEVPFYVPGQLLVSVVSTPFTELRQELVFDECGRAEVNHHVHATKLVRT